MTAIQWKKMLMVGLIMWVAALLLVGCSGTAVPTTTPILATLTPTILPTLATQLPDLEIGGYNVTYDDCPWGGPGTVSVSVDNFGVGDAGPFEVTINNGTTNLDGLGSLGEAEAAVSFSAGPIGGINAEVDSAQQVAESDESNNSYMITFTPPPPCATPQP
jgi:CARDB